VSKYPAFDPHQVPVSQVDSHLPAIAGALLLPEHIRLRFKSPPAWSPELKRETQFSDRVPTNAAVLVPIVLRDQPTVLLTQRTAHLSSHSGQIAFPGGKSDADDADAIATALREAHEEVGLDAKYVEILGSLPEYITGTSFVVTPVIGLIRPEFDLLPNANEVADVFEVPLHFLMDPANHRHHVLDWAGARRQWLSMPYMDGPKERYIWGATAGMLRNLYRFFAATHL
jgi:8-oxo-dGTP pyrophosphatase MutT (NUDIX family)